jgi:mannosyltransferase OCH1-like enzyme
MIPKIIHQTWKTKKIPGRFQNAAASWKQHHPDWKYCLWTDDALHAFVKRKFPKIWPLFQRYPETIQRVDAARYMILYHYGGLYSDLDIVCIRPMDPFLCYGALMAPTHPLGLSNDLMMARPGHPLFKEFIDHLEKAFTTWQRIILIRHFRILMTTGPLFVTMVHKKAGPIPDLYLLSHAHYSSQDKETAHVIHIPGDTWAGWDTHLLNFVFRRWKSILFLIFFLICLLIFRMT